jgi:hypothetical protein
MSYGKVLLTLMVLGFMFVGCNKPDVNQFITRESLDEATVACVGSTDRLCKYRPAFAKAEKYCSDNKMSDTQCKELMNAVTKKALSLTDDQNDEIKQTTDKFNQVTEEIRRKNAK